MINLKVSRGNEAGKSNAINWLRCLPGKRALTFFGYAWDLRKQDANLEDREQAHSALPSPVET